MKISFDMCRGESFLLPAVVLIGFAACGTPTSVTSPVSCDPDNGGLSLPPGFCAVVVARDIGAARHLVVRPNGDVYVAINNTGTTTGGIVALRDADGDGFAETLARFGPAGGNGIGWRDASLYFAPDDRILRYDFSGNELAPAGDPVVVVSGLPANSNGEHDRKSIVLDGAGGLLVNIGSPSDACQVQNRIPNSPGKTPCDELDTRAGIWRYSATAAGQTHAAAARYAAELRNMNALAWDPASGALFGVQNGRDFLHLYWPGRYSAQDHLVNPAEEVFRIEAGKRYGWPYCYFDWVGQRKLLSPEYGGDGTATGICTDRERPVAAFPAHWAPLGMLFHSGAGVPAEYAGGLFVAFHGSQFDPAPPATGAGYVVTFTPWRNGLPAGPYRIFADGFAGGHFTPATALHRAVGLAEGPDGSLYISDDKAGWVWRVIHRQR